MAKDPAFLFYYRDFISQTRFYSDTATGMLMRILCAQAEHGHLPLLQIRSLYLTDESAWGEISARFQVDEKGLFYDEWLDKTNEKRELYKKGRVQNLKGKGQKLSHMDTPHGNPICVNANANADANSFLREEIKHPMDIPLPF